MISADRRAFAASLLPLAEVYEKTISEAMAEIYFDALSEFDLREIQAAIREAVRTCEHFPRPATLVRLAMEVRRDRRQMLGNGRRALAPGDHVLTQEEAAGFLRQLRERLAVFVAPGSSSASRRTLREIEADLERLKALPRDPEHERRKHEVVGAFLGQAATTNGKGVLG